MEVSLSQYSTKSEAESAGHRVSILVLMEVSLSPGMADMLSALSLPCFNPCFNGSLSLTFLTFGSVQNRVSMFQSLF